MHYLAAYEAHMEKLTAKEKMIIKAIGYSGFVCCVWYAIIVLVTEVV